MSIRLAASLAAAALLCACAGPKTAPAGPPNAPVPRAGQPGAIPLDPQQRAQLDAAVARVPGTLRSRLRYALASGDDGKPHLVVYDGEGLGVTGWRPGKPHEYVVFRVLNSAGGEHYDPEQNSIVAPIPPPPQRDVVVPKP
ncbi:MAG: hypothetical protein JO036_02645 [Candidatus Eremiobacteraeota bacterium]|nr:hypothetical protein [Candidatus Eremiobacteraeota bacterium]